MNLDVICTFRILDLRGLEKEDPQGSLASHHVQSNAAQQRSAETNCGIVLEQQKHKTQVHTVHL